MKNKTVTINSKDRYIIKDTIIVSGDTAYVAQNVFNGDIKIISPLEITFVQPERDSIGIALDVLHALDEYVPVFIEMLKQSRQEGGNNEDEN